MFVVSGFGHCPAFRWYYYITTVNISLPQFSSFAEHSVLRSWTIPSIIPHKLIVSPLRRNRRHLVNQATAGHLVMHEIVIGLPPGSAGFAQYCEASVFVFFRFGAFVLPPQMFRQWKSCFCHGLSKFFKNSFWCFLLCGPFDSEMAVLPTPNFFAIFCVFWDGGNVSPVWRSANTNVIIPFHGVSTRRELNNLVNYLMLTYYP